MTRKKAKHSTSSNSILIIFVLVFGAAAAIPKHAFAIVVIACIWVVLWQLGKREKQQKNQIPTSALVATRQQEPKNTSMNVSREGANKRGNSSRLTQSFHFFMFEPIFSPVNALNQPI